MFTDFIPNHTLVVSKYDPEGEPGVVAEVLEDGDILTIDWSGYGDLEFDVSARDVIAV